MADEDNWIDGIDFPADRSSAGDAAQLVDLQLANYLYRLRERSKLPITGGAERHKLALRRKKLLRN